VAPPRVQTVAAGLEHPWAVAFLPGGRFLVTERPGRLRLIDADGSLRPPLAGLPEVAAGGQGGLLDVVTDSDFARNRTIYFASASPVRAAPTARRWRARGWPRTSGGWRTCA
jgi:glucose/arabinose dehydrogenase